MMEKHFWGLTRYRIGPYFLGLDYAGNVIWFRSYRKQTAGGWSAVTLGSPGTSSIFTSDTHASNVLEDGYPMHFKASKKLQKFVMLEREKWQKAVDAKKEKSPPEGGTAEKVFNPDVYDSDMRFRDTLIIKCSHPQFLSRTLRLKPTLTMLYKFCYFYLWLVVGSFFLQGYLMFRSWVNPPARQGLIHLEEHALYIPRLLFAGFVTCVAWIVREAQPLIDPVVELLSSFFPQVNWGVATAENLATRAETLAHDTHPAAKERKRIEEENRRKKEEAMQRLWMRILAFIIFALTLLCVL